MNASMIKCQWRETVDAIRETRWKYLLLIPLVCLLLSGANILGSVRKIYEILLDEKHKQIVNFVELLTKNVDGDAKRGREGYVATIREQTEYIDRMLQIYAAAYRLQGDKLILITDRHFETSAFEPLDFPGLVEAVTRPGADKGGFVAGYMPEGQGYRELRLYYRWMPTVPDVSERYLVLAGVSEYSIASEMALRFSVGQWANMMLTFVLNVCLILFFLRLRAERGKDHF